MKDEASTHNDGTGEAPFWASARTFFLLCAASRWAEDDLREGVLRALGSANGFIGLRLEPRMRGAYMPEPKIHIKAVRKRSCLGCKRRSDVLECPSQGCEGEEYSGKRCDERAETVRVRGNVRKKIALELRPKREPCTLRAPQ